MFEEHNLAHQREAEDYIRLIFIEHDVVMENFKDKELLLKTFKTFSRYKEAFHNMREPRGPEHKTYIKEERNLLACMVEIRIVLAKGGKLTLDDPHSIGTNEIEEHVINEHMEEALFESFLDDEYMLRLLAGAMSSKAGDYEKVNTYLEAKRTKIKEMWVETHQLHPCDDHHNCISEGRG